MLCSACDGNDTHTHRDIQSYTYIYSFKHIREKTGQPIERADIAGKGETMRKKHSHNPKFGNGRQKVKYRRLNCYRIKKTAIITIMRWRRPRP